MERTLVAAATNLLARGFLVVPTDRVARDGAPAGALFAVARAIERVISFKAPARAVAVVGTGALAPAILDAQRAPLPGLLRGLGLTVVETDDEVNLVASYARAALDRGDDAIVVGVDKRFAQLVGDRLWWYDANKDARYTAEIVQKRFGVPPAQIAEWLAMVGNDDDGLPGIAGIGAKGATTLLETHGSIDAALAVLDTIKGRLGNALRAGLDALPRERARATLGGDRPLPVSLDDCAWAPATAAARNALYERLGFVELLVADGDAPAMQVEVCDTSEAFAAALARLGDGPIALHALLEDAAPVREAIAGVALSAGGDAIYVARGGAAWPALAAWLADPAAPKLGHDLVATVVALRHEGLALAGVIGDSACASHLTNPSNWAPHDLPVIAKHVLGKALPAEDAVRGVGAKRKAWGKLPERQAAEVAGLGADATVAIWRALSPAVEPARLAEYMALSETCARMELQGILIDVGELDRAEAALVTLEEGLTGEIEALAGRGFNINSTKQLGAVLFEELKLPVASHTKTGWSTSQEALEKIEHAHPIVPLVIRWRLLRRLRDSWVTALRRCVDDDGRVHSRFHPARSFSGHLVNTNPDLGRVPGRTPEMEMIRRAFVAPPGRLLMSVDFNQLGLHVLAHLTRDPALVEPLRRRADMHLLTASALLDKPVEAITDAERQLGKVVNFATFAGQGSSALALQLGVTAAEAKQLIARFDEHYAQVRAFQDEQLRLARERGYIVTIAGRRWPIGGLESLDPHDRSYAERLARRATHEGSVADVARRALLDADRALRAAGLAATPVHEIVDEVLFEVPEAELAEAARIAAETMRGAFAPLEVPLVVGVWAGRSWADLEAVAVP
jgi:DNA polymerase-1